MTVLLDTQSWLWMQVAPERFAPGVLELLEDSGTELLLSAASSWEIAIKYALGRIELPELPATYVPSRMKSSRVRGLAIEHTHALHVATLPPHHRDPFDRLIIAQAQIEDLPILTSDRQLEAYDVAIRWVN